MQHLINCIRFCALDFLTESVLALIGDDSKKFLEKIFGKNRRTGYEGRESEKQKAVRIGLIVSMPLNELLIKLW